MPIDTGMSLCCEPLPLAFTRSAPGSPLDQFDSGRVPGWKTPSSGRMFRRCVSAGLKILCAQTAERPAWPSFRRQMTFRGTSRQIWSQRALRLFSYNTASSFTVPLAISPWCPDDPRPPCHAGEKPDSPAAFLSPTIDTRAGHAPQLFHYVSLSLNQYHYR